MGGRILKGFILILVCLNHSRVNLPLFVVSGDFISLTMAFRMTTFFFLSGLLFSTRRHPTILSYAKSKTKSLLLPYIFLSLLFAFLDPRLYDISLIERNNDICHQYLCPSDIQSSIDYLKMELVSIFVWGYNSISGPLWFVFVLFYTSVLFFCVHHISKGNIKILIGYALFCLTAGWCCYSYDIVLPFKIATILTASFFFALGYLCKSAIGVLNRTSAVRLLLIALFLLPIYVYAVNINGYTALHTNTLGSNFFFYILSTVSGIFLIVSAFIAFGKIVTKSMVQGVLKNIARNALIVLAVHHWTLQCCRIFLYELTAKSYYPWLATLIMIVVTIIAIPLFRTRLYRLIGKEKISVRESLAIR